MQGAENQAISPGSDRTPCEVLGQSRNPLLVLVPPLQGLSPLLSHDVGFTLEAPVTSTKGSLQAVCLQPGLWPSRVAWSLYL